MAQHFEMHCYVNELLNGSWLALFYCDFFFILKSIEVGKLALLCIECVAKYIVCTHKTSYSISNTGLIVNWFILIFTLFCNYAFIRQWPN